MAADSNHNITARLLTSAVAVYNEVEPSGLNLVYDTVSPTQRHYVTANVSCSNCCYCCSAACLLLRAGYTGTLHQINKQATPLLTMT